MINYDQQSRTWAFDLRSAARRRLDHCFSSNHRMPLNSFLADGLGLPAFRRIDRLGSALGQPVLTYAFLPKLHGTNASIEVTKKGIKAFSKNNELALGFDNHGFYAYTCGINKEALMDFFIPDTTLTIYGEWCGKGIHSNAKDAVCHIEKKTFYVFALKIDDNMVTDLSSFKGILEKIMGFKIEHSCKSRRLC